jgi:hypothetical protein
MHKVPQCPYPREFRIVCFTTPANRFEHSKPQQTLKHISHCPGSQSGPEEMWDQVGESGEGRRDGWSGREGGGGREREREI